MVMRIGLTEEVLEVTGARARVRRLAPGLLQVTLEGVADEALFNRLHDACAGEIDDAQGLTIFYDSTALQGFTHAFRMKMAAWQSRTKGRQFQIVLLRSAILAGAIDLANRVVGGGATVTSNRARWDALLATAVQNRFPDVDSGDVQSRLPRL